MPDLFDEFFGKGFDNNLYQPKTQSSIPAVNILENDNSFILEVAAPGLKKEDFRIDVEHDKLIVSSEKEQDESREDEGKYRRKEYYYASFRRVFTLPDTVNHDSIEAKHQDGILLITIPKREESKIKPPRTIQIV
ncbi:MAG: Hsp20/alpha crystallin family protein [Bacteroidales bacterium]|nr:Hsp20/alpha crystallin family protein [Bacteroidales bacterium]